MARKGIVKDEVKEEGRERGRSVCLSFVHL